MARTKIPEVRRPNAAWVGFGLTGRAILEAARHGNKESDLKVAAAKMGITAQTARRSAAALTFVEAEKFPVALTTLPLTAVECLRRWFSYDPEAARRAAQRLFDGASVAWVAEEEKKARRVIGARPPAARFLSDEIFMEIVGLIEQRHVGLRHNPMIARMRQRAEHRSELAALPPADLYFSDARGKKLLAAATILRPPHAPRGLTPFAARSLVHALGLSTIFDKSIVACLNRATFDYCTWWLTENREGGRIILEYCPAEPE